MVSVAEQKRRAEELRKRLKEDAVEVAPRVVVSPSRVTTGGAARAPQPPPVSPAVQATRERAEEAEEIREEAKEKGVSPEVIAARRRATAVSAIREEAQERGVDVSTPAKERGFIETLKQEVRGSEEKEVLLEQRQIDTFRGVPVFKIVAIENGVERKATTEEARFFRERERAVLPAREPSRIEEFRREAEVETIKGEPTVKGIAGGIVAGISLSALSTIEFGKRLVTSPVTTVKESVKGISSIPARLPALALIVEREPAFATGFLAGEVLQAKAIGRLIPIRRRVPLKDSTTEFRAFVKRRDELFDVGVITRTKAESRQILGVSKQIAKDVGREANIGGGRAFLVERIGTGIGEQRITKIDLIGGARTLGGVERAREGSFKVFQDISARGVEARTISQATEEAIVRQGLRVGVPEVIRRRLPTLLVRPSIEKLRGFKVERIGIETTDLTGILKQTSIDDIVAFAGTTRRPVTRISREGIVRRFKVGDIDVRGLIKISDEFTDLAESGVTILRGGKLKRRLSFAAQESITKQVAGLTAQAEKQLTKTIKIKTPAPTIPTILKTKAVSKAPIKQKQITITPQAVKLDVRQLISQQSAQVSSQALKTRQKVRTDFKQRQDAAVRTQAKQRLDLGLKQRQRVRQRVRQRLRFGSPAEARVPIVKIPKTPFGLLPLPISKAEDILTIPKRKKRRGREGIGISAGFLATQLGLAPERLTAKQVRKLGKIPTASLGIRRGAIVIPDVPKGMK